MRNCRTSKSTYTASYQLLYVTRRAYACSPGNIVRRIWSCLCSSSTSRANFAGEDEEWNERKGEQVIRGDVAGKLPFGNLQQKAVN